jgi:hypothetical protein
MTVCGKRLTGLLAALAVLAGAGLASAQFRPAPSPTPVTAPIVAPLPSFTPLPTFTPAPALPTPVLAPQPAFAPQPVAVPQPGLVPQLTLTPATAPTFTPNTTHVPPPTPVRPPSPPPRASDYQWARSAFSSALSRSPREALRFLAGSAYSLPPHERQSLASQAVARLRSDVGRITDAWQALRKVSEAEGACCGEASGALAVLRGEVERRCLAGVLPELRGMLAGRQWEQLGRLARERLGPLQQLASVREALLEVSRLLPGDERLTRLQSAAEGPSLAGWQSLPLGRLPADLRKPAAVLRALASLLDMSEGKKGHPAAEEVLRALRELRANSPAPELADRLSVGLGARALLNGQPDTARRLLEETPDNPTVQAEAQGWLAEALKNADEDAARLAQTARAGTPPARPGTGTPTPRGPPEETPSVDNEVRADLRASFEGPAATEEAHAQTPDLTAPTPAARPTPPAEVVRARLAEQRQQVLADLAPARAPARQRLTWCAEVLRPHGLAVPAAGGPPPAASGAPFVVPYQDDEERKRCRRLEERLGWRLTAAEVQEVRALYRQGKGEEEALRRLAE